MAPRTGVQAAYHPETSGTPSSDPASPNYDPRADPGHPRYDQTYDPDSPYYIPRTGTSDTGREVHDQAEDEVTEADETDDDGWPADILERVTRANRVDDAATGELNDQARELTQGVETRPNPAIPGANYLAYPHPRLQQMVQQDVNPGEVGTAGDKWIEAGNAMTKFQNEVARAINNSEADWQGSAGNAARRFMADVGAWVGTAGQSAQLAGTQTNLHGQAVATARDTMPEPVPWDAGAARADIASSTNPLEVVTKAADYARQYQEHREAHQRAAEVVKTYDGNLGAASTMPAFGAPPVMGDGTGRLSIGSESDFGTFGRNVPGPGGGSGGELGGSSGSGGAGAGSGSGDGSGGVGLGGGTGDGSGSGSGSGGGGTGGGSGDSGGGSGTGGGIGSGTGGGSGSGSGGAGGSGSGAGTGGGWGTGSGSGSGVGGSGGPGGVGVVGGTDPGNTGGAGFVPGPGVGPGVGPGLPPVTGPGLGVVPGPTPGLGSSGPGFGPGIGALPIGGGIGPGAGYDSTRGGRGGLGSGFGPLGAGAGSGPGGVSSGSGSNGGRPGLGVGPGAGVGPLAGGQQAAGRGTARAGGGVRGAGLAGMPMGRSHDDEDAEHKRPDYLVEPDPDEIFGSDELTAPPVIGA